MYLIIVLKQYGITRPWHAVHGRTTIDVIIDGNVIKQHLFIQYYMQDTRYMKGLLECTFNNE